MSDLTLLIIKIGFLALLWVFIFILLYSLRSDLFGPKLTPLQRVAVQTARSRESAATTSPDAATTVTATAPPPRAAASASAPTVPATPSATEGDAQRLVITSGPRAGLEIDLPRTGLSIGRSSGSGLQITDDYTSNNHAKVVRWRDRWVVQDLGSTNGTFVDGRRITESTPVEIGTPVRIGTTTFELRR